MKKYDLTDETIKVKGHKLHRIKALGDFGCVKAGDIGGFIESEKNLSHNGDCWVGENARVFGNAWVYGNAQVSGNAEVSGNAWVYEDARVSGDAWVSGTALVSGNAKVYGDAWVSRNAWVCGNRIIN